MPAQADRGVRQERSTPCGRTQPEKMAEQIAAMSPLELLRLHALVMRELAEREVVRTSNNPVADYAELLVCRALSLKRAGRSTKGYDAEDAAGERYEIKSRRHSEEARSEVLSPIRDLDGEHFRHLVVVVFNADYTVERAFRLPRERIAAHGAYRKHVNGWMIPVRDSLWSDPQAIDITAEVRAAQCACVKGDPRKAALATTRHAYTRCI